MSAEARPVGANRGARVLGAVGTYVVLIGAALLTLTPFLLAIMAAFMEPRQLASQGVSLPMPPTLDNFTALGERRVDFGEAALVTVGVVLLVTAGQLLFSVMAAFAFARLRFPGRNLLFWVFLATLMVPQVVTVIPLYFMMSEAGFGGEFLGLVLPFMFGSPYAVFLLREQFRQIPQELIDAMRMDGAGTWSILFGLVVPLSRSTIVTLLLITVVSHWNNFMWPLMIGQNRIHVLTTATASLQEQYSNNITLVMAASVLAMLPLIVLFVIFQKQIVRSIRISSFR
ncbi:carbohydrate ABC transporter permease [Gulosibacter sp. ACHW.36C]|uniref:Carbohydrate ABC transporter permease n=1 Tax=Gulosibacter sediminis TaxID=1729695 RepID=A0ABY4N0Q5_9MICO|nr:carbohydrate ABC transporter permease [Gulosibacter sediminis]UQN14803.1 carbohydrate ABC transporter permease [Gulosibacter sediminis]